jgi:hypothetical protein
MPTSELDPHFQSLDNAQALGLANYSGVYFLCQGATVVYVGRAKNIARRLMGHLGHKDFDTVMAMRVPEERLASVELHWVRRLQPKLNRLLYPQREGVRPGPGRPATGKVTVQLRMAAATRDQLERLALKDSQSLSECAETALLRYFKTRRAKEQP